MEALRNELQDSIGSTAAVQELQTKREHELVHLRKTLEAETKNHETQLQETRQKYSQQIDQLNEQLDQYKKVNFKYVP